jgi:hypothetical protein
VAVSKKKHGNGLSSYFNVDFVDIASIKFDLLLQSVQVYFILQREQRKASRSSFSFLGRLLMFRRISSL